MVEQVLKVAISKTSGWVVTVTEAILSVLAMVDVYEIAAGKKS